jgi:hypothetical protein
MDWKANSGQTLSQIIDLLVFRVVRNSSVTRMCVWGVPEDTKRTPYVLGYHRFGSDFLPMC